MKTPIGSCSAKSRNSSAWGSVTDVVVGLAVVGLPAKVCEMQPAALSVTTDAAAIVALMRSRTIAIVDGCGECNSCIDGDHARYGCWGQESLGAVKWRRQ